MEISKFSCLQSYTLEDYVEAIGQLPPKPPILFENDAQRTVWAKIRNRHQGACLWLKDILLGEGTAPPLKWRRYKYARYYAEVLAEILWLTEAVYHKTCNPELLQFPSPESFWGFICWFNSELQMEKSGLTGYPDVLGKRKWDEMTRQELTSLKSLKFQPEIINSPHDLLLVEAQELARSDSGFLKKHLLPYIREMRGITKKIKESECLQLHYALPNGKLRITAKNRKLPNLSKL